jgi:hypothetical protein
VDDLSGMPIGHVGGWGLVAGNDGSGHVLKWVGVRGMIEKTEGGAGGKARGKKGEYIFEMKKVEIQKRMKPRGRQERKMNERAVHSPCKG